MTTPSPSPGTPPDTTPPRDWHVVLLEGVDPSAVEAFQEEGFGSVESVSHALAGDALRDVLRRAHMLGIRSGTRLPAEVLQAAAHLMAVGCFCIGTNQVDLTAAMRLGIPVFNAPFSNTRSVAELVLAHTIYLLRGIPQRNADLHRGLWVKSSANAHEARGKTLGLVGYGHIGSQVGVLAEQLGMVVLFYDPEARLPFGNARSMSSLDALLTQADVVSLHVPEAPSTTGLIGGHQLAAMRVGSSLINASRGGVVDIDALHAALQQAICRARRWTSFRPNRAPMTRPLRHPCARSTRWCSLRTLAAPRGRRKSTSAVKSQPNCCAMPSMAPPCPLSIFRSWPCQS